MTFFYNKKTDDEQIKYEVNMDTNKLMEIYQMTFEKYSNKREIKFVSKNIVDIQSTNETIVKDYEVKKINNEYEISYTLYNYPKICQIIDGLLKKETFENSYNYLQSLLVSNKQARIDEIRRKIDRELRIFNILLDDEKRDDKVFRKINIYCKEINNISNYDKELALQAEIISNLINIEVIDEKEISNLYINPIVKTKNKKIKN